MDVNMLNENKGKHFLFTTGIFMVIIATVAILFNVLGLLGIGFLDADASTATTTLERLFVLTLMINCGCATFWIITGIIGIVYAEHPNNAIAALVLGGISVVLGLGTVGLFICSNGISFLNMCGLIIVLLIHSYYLYGAILNFKCRDNVPKKTKEEKKAEKEAKKKGNGNIISA